MDVMARAWPLLLLTACGRIAFGTVDGGSDGLARAMLRAWGTAMQR